MNRFHVHIRVSDLAKSTAFYQTLFGVEPAVTKDDYAKWELADPAVNFAISQHGGTPGVEHVGIEAGNREELDAITRRLHAADEATFQEESTTCCYAVSDKTWVEDPSGVRWETFFTHGEAAVYGADASQHGRTEPGAAENPKVEPTTRDRCCG